MYAFSCWGDVRATLIVTDLISAVVRLLERDINSLVVEVREALEPVEL